METKRHSPWARKGRPADKEALSPRRRYRETPEVVAATCRLIRVCGKRVATEDTEDLLYLVKVVEEAERALAVGIDGVRRSGVTDRQIGKVLGTVFCGEPVTGRGGMCLVEGWVHGDGRLVEIEALDPAAHTACYMAATPAERAAIAMRASGFEDRLS